MKKSIRPLRIIAPLLISFVLSILVVHIYNTDYQRNVIAMFSQKKEMIDILADSMESMIVRNKDYPVQKSFYKEWLVNDIERIDNQPFTYAALYSPELTKLSKPAAFTRDGNIAFDFEEPTSKNEFIEKVNNNQSGVVRINSKNDLNIFYFRWCPNGQGEKFLLVTGIHIDHIIVGKSDYLYVVMAMIVITVVMNVGLVMREWH